MSSLVRTIQTPFDSLYRSSTPTPKSAGKPTLNCCGGSLSTFGNMNRPVAANAAADAAENAPHAMPSQMRRVNSGELSSGSRELTLAAVAAAVVVLPARSTAGAAGLGGTGGVGFGATGAAAAAAAGTATVCATGATGFATAGATGATGAAGAFGASDLPAVAPVGAEAGGFVSSAISFSLFVLRFSLPERFQRIRCRLTHLHVVVIGAQLSHLVRQRAFLQRRDRAEAADHHFTDG